MKFILLLFIVFISLFCNSATSFLLSSNAHNNDNNSNNDNKESNPPTNSNILRYVYKDGTTMEFFINRKGEEKLRLYGSIPKGFSAKEAIKLFRSIQRQEKNKQNVVNLSDEEQKRRNEHNSGQGNNKGQKSSTVGPILWENETDDDDLNFDDKLVEEQFQSTSQNGKKKQENQIEEKNSGLFDSLASLFEGTSLDRVRHYFAIQQKEEIIQQRKHDIERVKDELLSVRADLAAIATQTRILRKRQMELSGYLNDDSVKNNKVVEDLVIMEDDRLALLDFRLKRMRKSLLKQEVELEQFLQAFGLDAANLSDTSTENLSLNQGNNNNNNNNNAEARDFDYTFHQSSSGATYHEFSRKSD